MKNNPFPQAQMLDFQGVLHEGHGPVHNPARKSFVLDNLLKSIAIRLAPTGPNRPRTHPLSGFCAGLAHGLLTAAFEPLRAGHNLPNRREHRINSALAIAFD